MFGDSRALFTDNSNNNAIFSSTPPKKVEDDMLTKNRINFDMNNTNNNSNNNSTQTNSGLLRFRSAPSSLFTNNGDNNNNNNNNNNNIADDLMSDGSLGTTNAFSVNSHLPPHYPRQRRRRQQQQLNNNNNNNNSNTSSSSLMVDSCGSYRMNDEAKMAVVSSIMRQNSSPPALLLSHLNSQSSGYGAMRGGVLGHYRVGNGSTADLSPTASRLKSQLSFSSGLPSSLGMLSRISEIENENIGGANGNDETKNSSGNGNNQFYASEFPLSSWSDSLHFAENYSGLKRDFDDDDKLFSGVQNNDIASRPSLLTHHLSLPKTSSEMDAMDKLLQYQDSVPCKIRAKRGCATHPRSIAERVRRTRISERMRKLQELVPHMDKQTNTADMLDLAVEYIKDLQKQFKTLSDNRANCKCAGMQKPVFH